MYDEHIRGWLCGFLPFYIIMIVFFGWFKDGTVGFEKFD